MAMPEPAFHLSNTEVNPTPALEKRTRRVFSTEYKLQILSEADQCARGGLGVLLHREKIDSGQLQQWRRDCAEHGVDGSSKSIPAPKSLKSVEQRRIEQLEKENAKLTRKLQVGKNCLGLPKQTCVHPRSHGRCAGNRGRTTDLRQFATRVQHMRRSLSKGNTAWTALSSVSFGSFTAAHWRSRVSRLGLAPST
jgi:transposase-like protein